jgi:hypothetical protein
MAFSHTLQAMVLNHFFRNNSQTAPATHFIALYTVAPTDAGGGTEVSGGGYARQAVTFGAPSGGSPTSVTNTAQVQFPVATANWGTIVAAAIFTAATGGTFLGWGPLQTNKAINSGDQAVFNAGDATVQIT